MKYKNLNLSSLKNNFQFFWKFLTLHAHVMSSGDDLQVLNFPHSLISFFRQSVSELQSFHVK